MQFLIDADLPRSTKALLESYGHIAIDLRDIGMRRAKDSQIAQHAQANGLCLLTGDWGFSDIRIFPPEQYAGIVIVGAPHATASQILSIIRSFWTDLILSPNFPAGWPSSKEPASVCGPPTDGHDV